ncbi:MAG: hypothetical protein HOD92_24600 [Deltaproteobacteria bacterium]|nr:hypothetical protein [Deltaproteobacteria bacterium]
MEKNTLICHFDEERGEIFVELIRSLTLARVSQFSVRDDKRLNEIEKRYKFPSLKLPLQKYHHVIYR